MTEQNLTVYEQAVTTDRPAEMLAQKHGFESLAQLASSLPEGARVLDVGAGASPFGKEVATLRPDISWTNFDYSYQNPAILDEVNVNTPTNLAHTAGDATKLAEVYEPGSFDAVFSYWLLPHLSIDDSKPAHDAAKAIFAVTKDGGVMSVGPQTSGLLRLKSGPALTVIKDGSQSADRYADTVVAATKLSKTPRFTQKLANEVATPFFGTTRYAQRKGKLPHIYHPQTSEYVSLLSRKGVATAGRLAITLAKHAAKQRKATKQ
jgi:ubiquinone/menaquinone biosynthesis C-methylase UbiE